MIDQQCQISCWRFSHGSIYALAPIFTGMLKQHLKEISIKRLLGINLNQVLLMTFSYYLVLLLLTFIVAFLITNQALIKYLLLLGSIVEIVLVFSF